MLTIISKERLIRIVRMATANYTTVFIWQSRDGTATVHVQGFDWLIKHRYSIQFLEFHSEFSEEFIARDFGTVFKSFTNYERR